MIEPCVLGKAGLELVELRDPNIFYGTSERVARC